jgi:hypothetical protein
MNSTVISSFGKFLIGFLLSLSVIFLSQALLSLLNRELIPVSHKLATVGLPGAGRTTLITALFELIQQGFPVQGIRPYDTSTIRAVRGNVRQHELEGRGRAFGCSASAPNLCSLDLNSTPRIYPPCRVGSPR